MASNKVLMVAEKPSIAFSIANVLSSGQMSTRKASTDVHEFEGTFHGFHVQFKVTSVIGHVFSLDFPETYQNWTVTDPLDLFQAPVRKAEANPKAHIRRHLSQEARGFGNLVLWLDCDREGENICFEVIDCIGHTNETKRKIYRARFSSVTEKDILKAMDNLVEPNKDEALAVDARQEIDLKVGVAFTRFQTSFFQGKYGNLDARVISYGPCQTPTLGFCVQRYLQINTFKPEKFWSVRPYILQSGYELQLDWERNKLFDVDVAVMFQKLVMEDGIAEVTEISEKQESKGRPSGLNTVNLLKIASSALGFGPQMAMQVAERLYTQGFISYPRTESTAYPSSFDFRGTLGAQVNNPVWGSYVQRLLTDGYQKPRSGTDAGDHPPVTPLRSATEDMLGNDAWRLYEYVCKHFIGTVSPDCKYVRTKAEFSIGGEFFHCVGQRVLVKGFTSIMPWLAVNEKNLPQFTKGEKIEVGRVDLHEGMTSPPEYLSESELISLMEKNGIGTDASISVHINNICERNYVQVQAGRKLVPTALADLHKAVVFRGAPWKAEIGRWLAGCGSISNEVNIVELIGGSGCKNDCSGRGVCNRELGQCRCFHGYSGEGCSETLQLECNYPGSPEQPYGRWVVSICSAHCDTKRAMCFCGEGTKYPNRPVAEACGFQVKPPSEPGAPKLTDWAKDDLDNVLTTNSSKPGWCNVDPAEAYALKVQFKQECDCKYDCLSGRFCEVPVLCTCINQCSGHGYCHGGFCRCNNGWYGIDCSIPSVASSVREWPQWLRPAQVDIPDSSQLTGKVVNLNAAVKKKRPLIYVYDLPPDFNSLLLEGRHFKFECVNRIYNDLNSTVWTDMLYGAQMALYESMLASPYRTLNGEEADFFFVPVLDSCIITRADDAPHLSMQEHKGLRSSLTLEYYRKAYDHIVEQYPFWNRSSGRDHIWFFSWDEGACYAPKEIWNSMMLVHWGNTNSKHKHSTTAYWADNWNDISSNKRGNHPCFDPDKDLVLPAWKSPDVNSLSSKLWARPHEMRKTLFYFNGNLGPAYPKGRPETSYSMGIRQKLAEEFGSSANKEGKLGKQHAEDVIVTPLRSENYHEDLASSTFCGVFPGDGWSGRMEDSILQGCIPVVIQDGIFLPYENVLNYESFAVRIREDEIPNLINILRAFNETEIKFRLANVQKIWQRFLYRDSILLEAERQKTGFGHMDDWAVQFSQLIEDDVFQTFVQVLHYKLHNDPWRQHVHVKKEFGLPRECLINRN